MTASARLLRGAAGAELVSLLVLMANLLTEHWPAVSSLTGPTHGCAYLLVIITVSREAGARSRATMLALIPAVGGLLALRRLTAESTAGTAGEVRAAGQDAAR